ncbi:hypothetical protein [Hydrogenobacter thermophilus]|uniref:Cytochrome c n=1 Tax=Hydrogenobacter thermophilus (strain DSM 6534 / IAM 12695 / TK-6) TaxID=608538 RepID=D3DH36_HYDTT|nr:hypothetical protein [Hydrogenobacter thermophilus]BAI69138.1 hypothetical protein HTH_0678 [Hydrogenobacter thermophilus TK-6]
MRKVFLLMVFTFLWAHAEEELTFRQVMQVVNSATLRMLEGFLMNNDELIIRGAQEIAHHPMPKGGPLAYIDPSKREEFAKAMPTFERQVHDSAEEVLRLIKEKRRDEAYEKFNYMVKGCMGCHSLFRDYGKR